MSKEDEKNMAAVRESIRKVNEAKQTVAQTEQKIRTLKQRRTR